MEEEKKKRQSKTFTKSELLKAIKNFCMQCQGIEKGQSIDSVKECIENENSQYGECVLWKYRLGKKI